MGKILQEVVHEIARNLDKKQDGKELIANFVEKLKARFIKTGVQRIGITPYPHQFDLVDLFFTRICGEVFVNILFIPDYDMERPMALQAGGFELFDYSVFSEKLSKVSPNDIQKIVRVISNQHFFAWYC